VVFAFDESIATLEARTAGLGIDFKAGIEAGSVRLVQIDPAEVSPGEFVHRVRESVERNQAKVIVIDSLNGYMNAMPEEHHLMAQLHEMLTYLGRKGVTTIMVVAQHGLMGANMQTPVDTSYLADSVVLFRYFEAEGRIKKAISVIKKRSGSHEDTIRELSFSPKGISVSEPLHRYRGILTGVPVPAALHQQAHF
jgi:circadian clock protein KaiC